MPLDEAPGCVMALLRGLLHLFWVLADFGHFGEILGYPGAWTVRLLTFGRRKPDPESWEAILVGGVLFSILVVAAAVSRAR